MPGPAWLTNRPIAHRGLHDARSGVIENTASAAAAAIASNYGMETDLQISADGEAMVFHDDTLERLTNATGAVAKMSRLELQRVTFKVTNDHMLTLRELLDLVAGRILLLLELKSRFDGDTRIARRAIEVLKSYDGPVALMSFDPRLIAAVRGLAPKRLRGIVAERTYDHPDWRFLSTWQKRELALMLHAPFTRPQFIAYNVQHLPAPVPSLARSLFGLPVLTWTVRTPADQQRAARHADQMIFEGFHA
jgi:glycerophosphoryl diester phosphodiesterase